MFKICLSALLLSIGSLPTYACILPHIASMQVTLDAQYIVVGTIRTLDPEVVEPIVIEGEVRESHFATATMDIDQVLHGDHDAPSLFFRLGFGANILQGHGGRAVVVALNRDFSLDETWEALPHDRRRYDGFNDGCVEYIFHLEGVTDLSGQFLIEMFDGDGDPAEEAAVFDRFLRGAGVY